MCIAVASVCCVLSSVVKQSTIKNRFDLFASHTYLDEQEELDKFPLLRESQDTPIPGSRQAAGEGSNGILPLSHGRPHSCCIVEVTTEPKRSIITAGRKI